MLSVNSNLTRIIIEFHYKYFFEKCLVKHSLDGIRGALVGSIAINCQIKGEAGVKRFVAWREQVVAILETQSVDLSAVHFDGRLTSLEMTEKLDRERSILALTQGMDTTFVLPNPLLAVFRLYDSLPGRWFLVDPWSKSDLNVTDEKGFSFLSK